MACAVLDMGDIELLAQGLLDVGGLNSPSVLASQNRFRVLLCSGSPEAKSNPWLRRLAVRCGVSARDTEFAIAHELIELHLEGHRFDATHEATCDQGARALVMPHWLFAPAVAAMGSELDVFDLAKQFPWAPLEQIAFRLVDLGLAAASSSWVGARVQERILARGVSFSQALQWAEYEVLGMVYGKGKRRRRQHLGPFCTLAWRTHEPVPNAAVVICQRQTAQATEGREHLVLKYD